MNEKVESLDSEMYEDLKNTNRFLRKLLVAAFIVIGILVAALAGTNVYHIHQWSQFDTVVVDSDQGPACRGGSGRISDAGFRLLRSPST